MEYEEEVEVCMDDGDVVVTRKTDDTPGGR